MIDAVSFKKASEEDLPELLEIYSYYIENSTATCQISPIDLAAMRKIILPENPRYRSYSIFAGDILCGYALFTRFKEREAFNDAAEVTIYLKPGFTGNGIGRAALMKLETDAKIADIHALIALISSDNCGSLRLFEKCGYVKCADFREVCKKFGKVFGLVCYEKLL